TVRDAAVMLGVLAGVDPDDVATAASSGRAAADYAAGLDRSALKGARIGVHRKAFGFHRDVDRVLEGALDAMRREGAVLIDPADVPHTGEYDDSETEVLLYELKADLAAYLATLGAGAPVKTLADVIAFNQAHAAEEMPYFGQEL